MPKIEEIQRNFRDIYFNFVTRFLIISVKLIYANKDYDWITNFATCSAILFQC